MGRPYEKNFFFNIHGPLIAEVETFNYSSTRTLQHMVVCPLACQECEVLSRPGCQQILYNQQPEAELVHNTTNQWLVR